MKIGLHYSFQCKDEKAADIVEAGLADIVAADARGFSSAVFAEHHFLEDGWLPRPMLLAAAAAALTKRMRVGTDIVVLPLHHPVAVAEEIVVVDILSGGRAILGVGLGWMEREFEGFGVPYTDRVAIFKSSIAAIRSLLKGETVDGDGHYSFRGAALRPLPVSHDGIPVWAGALTDAGVRRTARTADAWVMPPGTRLDDLARQRRLLDETRAAAGLEPVREQPLRREAFVAESDAAAWKLFAPGIRHEYGVVYRPLHPTYPEPDTIDALRRWGEDLFVVGSPETVREEFRRYEAATKATEFLLRVQLPGIPGGAIKESLEGLASLLSIEGDAAREADGALSATEADRGW